MSFSSSSSAIVEIKTGETFKSKRDASGSSLGPLDAACKWALEHQIQGSEENDVATPMLIFNEEMGNASYSWRQLCALEITTVIDKARDRTTPMFYHEIIPTNGYAKLAYDIEAKFGSPDDIAKLKAAFGTDDVSAIRLGCDRLTELVIEATVRLLTPLIGRELARETIIRLDCSREDKWSKHVVIDGSDNEHESVAFATDEDCREFVRRVLAEPEMASFKDALNLIVDKGVYSTRHPLRTYYSAKRSNEAHLMRLESGIGPCDASVFARSLRSCFIVHNAQGAFYHQSDDGSKYVTSMFLIDYPEAMTSKPIRLGSRLPNGFFSTPSSGATTSLATRSVGAGSPVGLFAGRLISALVNAPELDVYKPKSGKFRDFNTIRIVSGGVVCADKDGGMHKKGHHCVYLVVDVLRRQFVQECWSSTCIDKRKMQPPRNRLLPPLVCDAISDYLCSNEWEPGVVVGTDFASCLGFIQ